MKKLIFGTLVLAFVIVCPVPMLARAEVDVNIGIGLPLPIVLDAPPMLVVVPGTYVYAVPDIAVDLFFYDGWWWRPWQGRWYRSRHYNSGWVYYQRIPSFYAQIHPGWRESYRKHRWEGHRWNYKGISQQHVEQNWKGWKKINIGKKNLGMLKDFEKDRDHDNNTRRQFQNSERDDHKIYSNNRETMKRGEEKKQGRKKV